jgi:hypothetical protein
MKCAILKQIYDIFGPWRSIRWKDTTPKEHLRFWPYKATSFEMTCLLEADWYVVPFVHDSEYVRYVAFPENLDPFWFESARRRRSLLEKHTETTSIEDVPFEEYDVIITLDPILRPPRFSKPLFAYVHNEHTDPAFAVSKLQPFPGYDLFLDHMLQSRIDITSVPQPVSFPYPRCPQVLRSMFRERIPSSVYLDPRTVIGAARGNPYVPWDSSSDELLRKVRMRHSAFSFVCRPELYRDYFNVGDEPRWGDAYEFIKSLSECEYLVSTAAAGAGQILCDAASLGVICVGNQNVIYHRKICHPFALCADIDSGLDRIHSIEADHGLRKEILVWQNRAIMEMSMKPEQTLENACELKRDKGSARADRCYGLRMHPNFMRHSSHQANVDILLEYSRQLESQGLHDDSMHRRNQASWFGLSMNGSVRREVQEPKGPMSNEPN